MPDNHEGHRKATRKGIPHHQDEFPFDTVRKEDSIPDGKQDVDIHNNASLRETSPKDTKSLREQKSRSVIRNRSLNDDEQPKDSMVKRVVDNLLHGDKEEEINNIEENKNEGEIIQEPFDELITEEEVMPEHNEKPDDEQAEADKYTGEFQSDGEETEQENESGNQEDSVEVINLEDEDNEEENEKESNAVAIEEKEPEEEVAITSPVGRERLAKRYEKIHNILFAVDLAVTVLAILAFLFFGGSRNLRDWIGIYASNPWIVPLLYSAVVTIVYYFVILIPLHAIDFHFENKFKLNTQSFSSWLDDNFKSLVLNMILMALFLEVTYFLLRAAPNYWWIWAAAVWTLFGVLMTNLVPILILPLFYKLSPLKDESLRNRLRSLAERVRMKVLNVYEIKLSQKTKKANAMLAGLGNTKRVILGDTLIKNYTGEEIETIIAHELGHHYHLHIPKLIVLGTVLAFAGFFLASLFLRTSIGWFDYLDIKWR